MKTEIVEHGDYKLTVSEATTLIGMRRTRLGVDGSQAGETDPDRHLLRVLIYPALVAAVTQAEGLPWPPTFEQFLELPEEFTIAWEDTVYRLNPHWAPGPANPGEKKAGPTTSIDG